MTTTKQTKAAAAKAEAPPSPGNPPTPLTPEADPTATEQTGDTLGAAVEVGADEVQAKLDEEQEKGYRGWKPEPADFDPRTGPMPQAVVPQQ